MSGGLKASELPGIDNGLGQHDCRKLRPESPQTPLPASAGLWEHGNGLALPRGLLREKGVGKPPFLLSAWGGWQQSDLADSPRPGQVFCWAESRLVRPPAEGTGFFPCREGELGRRGVRGGRSVLNTCV